MPTHIILLTTLVVLENSLRKASQEATSNKEKWPLDDLAKDINASLKVLSNLLQGRSLEKEGDICDPNLPTVQSEGSMESSSVAAKDSASNAIGSTENSSVTSDDRGPSRNRDLEYRQISSHKISRLHRIAFTLYSYKRKINQLRQLVESEPSLDLHGYPKWETMLHFTWDAKNKACLVSALGVSLPGECGYSDVMKPFLSVSQSEKALCSLLQAVQSGSNVLLTGYTVRFRINMTLGQMKACMELFLTLIFLFRFGPSCFPNPLVFVLFLFVLSHIMIVDIVLTYTQSNEGWTGLFFNLFINLFFALRG